MKCVRCGGLVVSDFIMTYEGGLNLLKCTLCGRITDTLCEINRANPPRPPERRGRKPNFALKEIKRKLISRRRKIFASN